MSANASHIPNAPSSSVLAGRLEDLWLAGGSGDVASAYRGRLLAELGAPAVAPSASRLIPATAPRHPDLDWALSGAMVLTGLPGAAPILAPGPLASCARGAVDALGQLACDCWPAGVDGARLLGERAAIAGYERRGSVSPGGSCRLLRAADGWLAVNLAREDDLRSLPAWLGDGELRDPWAFVAERIAKWPAVECVERARLLGMPVACAGPPALGVPSWLRVASRGGPGAANRKARPLVVDLSTLWAGPLSTHLLLLAGARVIKVESSRRPDGARRGPTRFFDLLNAGKESVALDIGSASGRRALSALLDRADIVVESARPRALAQLGIDASQRVASGSGVTWVSITGYGRDGPRANWVAFGDDAAADAGLAMAVAEGQASGPLFCGDAVADPLTGVHAALAAFAHWTRGGGVLLDLSLSDVVAHVLAFRPEDTPACRSAHVRPLSHSGTGSEIYAAAQGFEVVAGAARAVVARPSARVARTGARPLGADTASILEEHGIRC